MYNYDRLFVSIHGSFGHVYVRGGKRPSRYYHGDGAWNGEAVKIDGEWVVDSPKGKFYIGNPPRYGGEWVYKGNIDDLPRLDGEYQQEPQKPVLKPAKRVAPKPKGVTLEELLAEDE